jgi:rhamnosyltransferase
VPTDRALKQPSPRAPIRADRTVGVVVIAHNGRAHLERCLPPVANSKLRPQLLVVNSSPGDGTDEVARRFGAQLLEIAPASFDHGGTREQARRLLETDIVVMMSQDAYPADADTLGRLVAPVLAGDVAASYGRQVPRPGAHFFESFMRAFNYPSTSHVRSLADVERYGPYLFFFSDAFGAYDQRRLDEIGGFRPTLSHEDALAIAMLLRAGHRVAYVADAVVEHSHPDPFAGDLGRYYDARYARAGFGTALNPGGPEAKLGASYSRALVAEVSRSRPWLLPYAAVHLGVKWLGFRAGRAGRRAPNTVNRLLSGQKYYWNTPRDPEPVG